MKTGNSKKEKEELEKAREIIKTQKLSGVMKFHISRRYFYQTVLGR
jgi:hypothetical protein